MNNIKADIWGRSFQLEISFDQYKGESVTQAQKESLTAFCDNISALADSAKSAIIEYCANNCDEDLRSESNPFRFLLPTCIYVMRTEDKEHKAALLFKFKYDSENMVAAVFQNEKFLKVTTDSAIL